MKEEKQFFIGAVILVGIFVWTCTCSAAIAVVKIKNRMVPTPRALEGTYQQMGDYRDSYLRLPECRGKRLLSLYERTVSAVARLFEKQGSLINQYSSAFDDEDIDELLRLKRQIEINWGKVKSSIRHFEFACNEQCGTPRGKEDGEDSDGCSRKAPQGDSSFGMSLLGQENNEAVDAMENADAADVMEAVEPAKNQASSESIAQIRQNDRTLTDMSQESTVSILTRILGLTVGANCSSVSDSY